MHSQTLTASPQGTDRADPTGRSTSVAADTRKMTSPKRDDSDDDDSDDDDDERKQRAMRAAAAAERSLFRYFLSVLY